MIDAFKSILARRGGLSKANRFDVLITLPRGIVADQGRDLSFLVESSQIPGKQITSFEWSLYGHTIKVPTGYILEDVTMVFNITNDYYVKKIFDDWQNKVIDEHAYLLAYDSAFKADVHIRQLNEQDEIVYSATLVRAYPISVQSMMMDNAADSTTQKLSVTFAYDLVEHNK